MFESLFKLRHFLKKNLSRLNVNKRGKFVITSLCLPLGFLLLQVFDDQYRLWLIFLFTALTLGLFSWSLWEGLGKDSTLMVLILPTYFTLGVGLFWFLLPSYLYAKIPVVILFGVGIYALCLTANIFTVAAIRTIALSRAAKGVGFVLNLLTSFLLYDAVFSLKSEIWINSIAIFLVSFPLFLQGLWVSVLEKRFNLDLVRASAIYSLILVEIGSFLYFWPVTVVVGSLFLTVAVYMLLGLGQANLEGRLFKQTVGEYLLVGLFVFLAMLFATPWRG